MGQQASNDPYATIDLALKTSGVGLIDWTKSPYTNEVPEGFADDPLPYVVMVIEPSDKVDNFDAGAGGSTYIETYKFEIESAAILLPSHKGKPSPSSRGLA